MFMNKTFTVRMVNFEPKLMFHWSRPLETVEGRLLGCFFSPQKSRDQNSMISSFFSPLEA